MKKLLTLALAAFATLAAVAQTPTLEKDIIGGAIGGSPSSLTLYNNNIMMGVTDNATGRELWSYSIASQSAAMVADVVPGNVSGLRHLPAEEFAVFNDKLYFSCSDGGPAGWFRLNVYDGTTITTLLDSLGQLARDFHVLNGKLYFIANSGGVDENLWCYDPANGVRRISARINGNNISGLYRNLTAFNGKLYYRGFYMRGSEYGTELFAYDPAADTSGLVRLINRAAGPYLNGFTSSPFTDPSGFTTGGNKLYFAASDSATGCELYSYDGTTVTRLTDVAPGTDDGLVRNTTAITYFKGNVYFRVPTTSTGLAKLYKWDVARQRLVLIHSLQGAIGPAGLSALYATPNNLYFQHNSPTAGVELWKYNGTASAMVADLNPGTGSGIGNSNMITVDGSVYFNGNNGTTGNELYKVFDTPTAGIGMQAVSWKGAVSIYPNPATSSATLSISVQSMQSTRIAVTDVQGREVWAYPLHTLAAGTHEIKISMQQWPAGSYFYRLHDGRGKMLASGTVVKK